MRDCAERRRYLNKIAVAKCAVMHYHASKGTSFRHKKDKANLSVIVWEIYPDSHTFYLPSLDGRFSETVIQFRGVKDD
jgi:hypothetical protein